MKANIIEDHFFGYDVEIVTIGEDVTYYVFANRTPGRNWEVLSFRSMGEIAKQYMDNQFDYSVNNWLFLNKEAFTSKTDYCLWLNRKLSDVSVVSCLY